MNLDDVSMKLKRKNQILFSRSSPCLQDLLALIGEQKHRTLVMWAFLCVNAPLACLKAKYPQEERPETAVRLCREWAMGRVKMPIAKKALLEAHAVAKELSDPVDIALCHAVGQACATVHVETHAIGLPLYELTAIVRRWGIERCQEAVEEKISRYISCLADCAARIDSEAWEWADFLLRDAGANKEKLLLDKRRR